VSWWVMRCGGGCFDRRFLGANGCTHGCIEIVASGRHDSLGSGEAAHKRMALDEVERWTIHNRGQDFPRRVDNQTRIDNGHQFLRNPQTDAPIFRLVHIQAQVAPSGAHRTFELEQ
jgi:hypothetical protein